MAKNHMLELMALKLILLTSLLSKKWLPLEEGSTASMCHVLTFRVISQFYYSLRILSSTVLYAALLLTEST